MYEHLSLTNILHKPKFCYKSTKNESEMNPKSIQTHFHSNHVRLTPPNYNSVTNITYNNMIYEHLYVSTKLKWENETNRNQFSHIFIQITNK